MPREKIKTLREKIKTLIYLDLLMKTVSSQFMSYEYSVLSVKSEGGIGYMWSQ